MTGKNFMSSILDELMGRNRDALPTEVPKEVQWDDPEICPYYLVAFCPHELFVNTKADLGSCSKFHDDILRKKYQEEAPGYKRTQFEKEFIRFAEKMISDIEGKIKRGKMRIALANGPDGGTYAGPGSKNAEKIALLSERINVLLEEAEAAGCDGDVEKAQGIMKLCDQIKEERDQLRSNEVSHPWNPDKAMQVCEVCGSYLIIGEAQHRLDDHIMGKQHVGFAMLRKSLEDIRKAVERREVEEREKMEKDREMRLGGRRERIMSPPKDKRRDEKEKEPRKDRDRDSHRRDHGDRGGDKDRKRHRSRSKSKDRKDKDRHRDKDKDKSRDRKRDSSRDRKRHSDDKDKKRSKRSRSRSRDKKRSRSGSKGRKRSRSRSRDRKDKDRHSHRSSRHRDRESNDKRKNEEDSSPKRGEEKEAGSIDESERRGSTTNSSSPPPEKMQKVESQDCQESTLDSTVHPPLNLAQDDDDESDPPPPGLA